MKVTLDEVIINAPKNLVIDFETTGLDWIRDQALLLGIAGNDYKSHVDIREYSKEQLKAFFDTLLKSRKLIFHNAKFDLHWIERYTTAPRGSDIEDTMIMSQLIDERISHSLESLVEQYFGEELLGAKKFTNALMKKGKLNSFSQLPPEALSDRAEEDAYNTFLLYNELTKELLVPKVYALEKKVLHVLLGVERRGVSVDVEYLKSCKERILDEIQILTKKYPEIELGSSPQVGKEMERLGVFPVLYTDKGKASWCVEAINQIEGVPFADDVKRYRTLVHTLSTYIQCFLDIVDSNNKIHCNYRQLGAKTGRLSCVDPNLQQLPSHGEIGEMVKRAIVGKLSLFDYSQMEAVLYAYITRDKGMLEMCKKEEDLYKYLGSLIYNKHIDEVTKEERGLAKILFLGRIYGMGDRNFYKQVPYDRKPYVDETFKGCVKFSNRVKESIISKGYTETILKRRRHLLPRESYKGLNAIIQGSAADILKLIMINLGEFEEKLRLTTHDDFAFEDLSNEEIDAVNEIMTNLPYKLVASIGSGNNFWEASYNAKEGINKYHAR